MMLYHFVITLLIVLVNFFLFNVVNFLYWGIVGGHVAKTSKPWLVLSILVSIILLLVACDIILIYIITIPPV